MSAAKFKFAERLAILSSLEYLFMVASFSLFVLSNWAPGKSRMFIKDIRILFFYLNTPIDNLQAKLGFL